jgi:hypothetical protein
MTAVPSDKGVVVFSTSADSTSSVASIGLYLVQAATRKRYDRVVINIDYPFKSHFPSEHAHVRSLTLPAGDYYFIPYGDNAIFCLVKYPTYGFSVEAGSIAYLGAFRLSSNALTVSSYRRERDVAYFVDRNPSLRSEEIKPEALVIGDRSVDSCDADESVDGIIWNLP